MVRKLAVFSALWIVESQMNGGGSVLRCSLYRCGYRSSDSSRDLSKAQGCRVAELGCKPRPPDSDTCSINHKASIVPLSLEPSDTIFALTGSCNFQVRRAGAIELLESLDPVLRIHTVGHIRAPSALNPRYQRIAHEPATSASPGSVFEMQDLRSHPRRLKPNAC